jgi:hypothetical protein
VLSANAPYASPERENDGTSPERRWPPGGGGCETTTLRVDLPGAGVCDVRPGFVDPVAKPNAGKRGELDALSGFCVAPQ